VSRYRTVVGEVLDEKTGGQLGFNVLPDVDRKNTLQGRVLSVHGVSSIVQAEDGQRYRCLTSRVLKTLSTEQRQPVVAGDNVLIRKVQHGEAMLERVEPRHGTLSRESRHRRQVLVTNVDQILLVASADQPMFKPNLLDRMLLSTEQSGITPVICINKADLVDSADLQPVIGNYAQMGYKVLVLSVKTGLGIERLRRQLQGKESAVAGQSGVGKSSLLNAVDPALNLRVSELSTADKGKHTTTTAELFQLSFGGYVADTPGLRQFMLWDIIPAEVFGLFRDLRPYENRCRFPDCTHSHEDDCAVKDAVADGRLDLRRYESYLAIRFGE
jgi:ribosome biogenesis GTPase